MEKLVQKENSRLLRAIVESAVYFLLGVLVCRGMIFSTLAPFGCSYVAAVPRKRLFFATLGASLGYIILKPYDSFRYVAVAASIALVRWLAEDIKPLSRSVFFAPAAAFVPVFGSGVVMMFVSTSTISDFSVVTVEALLAAGAAYFISRSLELVNSGRRPATYTQSELSGLVMTGCALILSVGSIGIEGISVGRILAAVIIMLCARYGSAAGGAIAGACTGTVFGLSRAGFAYIGAGYSFGGLVGGLFAPVGKLGVSVSFVICNAVILLSSGDRELALPMFVETVIAAAVFMILPREAERYITPVFLPKESTKGERSLRNSVVMRLEFASGALKNVEGCVNSVSRQLKKLYAPSVEQVYEKTAEDVCSNCGLRVYCWERQGNVTREDFLRLSAPLKSRGYIGENDVENLFSKKCCRAVEIADRVNSNYRDYLGGIEAAGRVNEVRSLVAGQFSGLSEILSDLARDIENYKSYDSDASVRVTEYLHSKSLVVIECACMIDTNGRMTVEIQLGGRSRLRRDELCRDISSICGRCFDTPLITEIGSQKRVVLGEVPLYDVEVGVFQHVYKNSKLCGDCVNCFTNGFGEFVAVLSDGMGTGGRAAVDSNMTVSILTKLLKAGLTEDSAVRIVNSALMVKSEDESLATVDLLKLDMFSGKCTICKAGAPFTLIRKNGHIIKKSAASLPIGILGDINCAGDKAKLSGGDVVVMISDGAVTSDEKWLEKLIREHSGNSSDLARLVVNEAIKRRNDGHDDDITAVAVKLIENK
ncbi:MAG: SpoIIE family protein phosphatase [Ruminococcus sp.]|nr:SpoIIE family protein phosphatase [Ruminococcus sp.]